MAQRSGDDEVADRMANINLEGLAGGEAKSSIGPAGLIHKVIRRYTHTTFCSRSHQLPDPPSHGRAVNLASSCNSRHLTGVYSGNGCKLCVQDSDAIKLFVGQIPKHMEEEDLRPVFEEFGEIFDLAVIRDKISGLHRGAYRVRLAGVSVLARSALGIRSSRVAR